MVEKEIIFNIRDCDFAYENVKKCIWGGLGIYVGPEISPAAFLNVFNLPRRRARVLREMRLDRFTEVKRLRGFRKKIYGGLGEYGEIFILCDDPDSRGLWKVLGGLLDFSLGYTGKEPILTDKETATSSLNFNLIFL